MTEDDQLTLARAFQSTGAELGTLRWVCTDPAAIFVPVRQVEPISRNEGIVGLHQHRVETILLRLRDALELDPIEATYLVNSPFQYRVRNGFHRYWIAVACGLVEIPLAAREPYDFEH